MSSVFGKAEDREPTGGRTESLLKQKKDLVVSTGIPGFDETLGQGLPSGNLYLVAGSLSSSSHQFVQQILYNTMISKGKVTYYSIENASTDIINDMQLLGMDIQKYVDEGSWTFARIIVPNMKKIIDALPEVPMELRIDIDDTFTKIMNHFHDSVKDGRNTAIHLPVLVRTYPLDEVQNLLFFMQGIARKYGGIHFLLLTEGAHDPMVEVTLKDTADTVFQVSTASRGTEVENTISIQKIRGMIPKVRMIKLAQRETGLATETIRRIQ